MIRGWTAELVGITIYYAAELLSENCNPSERMGVWTTSVIADSHRTPKQSRVQVQTSLHSFEWYQVTIPMGWALEMDPDVGGRIV